MSALQPGMMFGPYRLIHELGRGGMAVVWKAYHAAMDRSVAIKVLPYQFAQREEFLKRFRQEVRLIAKLEHPHILPVYDFGESEDLPYLVMRLLEAGTLTDRIRAGALSLDEVDRIFSQLADALGYAHEQGVIHRDIKPSNVMLDTRGTVFLTDFGIAKMVEGATHLTATGTITGTPEYMSPEQAQGFKLDGRTDIYSLGVVLYEMLTGQVPYYAETPVAVILKKIQDALPPPTVVNPAIPDTLELVLLKALAKDPADRYATMGEFLQAWKEALARSHEQVPTREIPPPKAGEPEGRPPAPPIEAPARREPVPTTMPTLAQRSRLPLWLLGVAGALVVVCILAAGAFAANRILRNRSTATERFIAAMAGPATETPSGLVAPANDELLAEEPAIPTNTSPPTNTPPLAAAIQMTEAPEPTKAPTATFPPEVTLPPTQILDKFGITMVLVPEGEFIMGSDMDEVMKICPGLYKGTSCDPAKFIGESGAHTVFLDSFYIDQYEVTNAAYAACVRAGACRSLPDTSSQTRAEYYGNPQYDNYPVIHVTWVEARAYCQWRGVRLPTEAEWEKAARGTDARFFPWGNTFSGKEANSCDRNCSEPRSIETFDDGYPETSPVGAFASGQSPYGAYDMAGNVWEWTADWYSQGYYASLPKDVHNPLGPSDGEDRVVRGGSWLSDAFNLRTALRYIFRPYLEAAHIGFRCARSP